MIIFLLLPIQENSIGEIPPPYCIGTIPSKSSYILIDIEFWTKSVFKYAIDNSIKMLGVAADNFSAHRSVWTSWYFSGNSHFKFIPASYKLIFETKCTPFHDPPHLLRNWLYNMQNLGKVMKLGEYPVLFEDLMTLWRYYPFDQNFLDVRKKMNQAAAEFFFS